MPYCIDLEFVGKSPYSATVNDAIHNWVHILGALTGLKRSKKATVVGSPAPALVLVAHPQNVQLLNVQLPNVQLPKVLISERPDYQTLSYQRSGLPNIQFT